MFQTILDLCAFNFRLTYQEESSQLLLGVYQMKERKSLNIYIKHVFICNNPWIYSLVVKEVYNRDRSPEVDDDESLAAAATKHLELLKQKDEAESSFIIIT